MRLKPLLTPALLLAMVGCRGPTPSEIDVDGDGVFANVDCNDDDPAIRPDAVDICDGIDNNCDGSIDNIAAGDGTLFYADSDADGFGSDNGALEACDLPAGYATVGGDCDDAAAAINPGAQEVCDGVDNDCDGGVDLNAVDPSTWYADADDDGFGDLASPIVACDQPSGAVVDATDCDDTLDTVHPNAVEVCNSVDDNCDGDIDGDATDAPTWYADVDGDGYGGSTATVACVAPQGHLSSSDDCDDSSAAVFPGADELCDGLDNDCNGDIDGGATDTPTWYADADADAFGDPTSATVQCNAPVGSVGNGNDCDDASASNYPGAAEVCDEVDNNCNQLIDDDPVDATPFYPDDDGDGVGTDLPSVLACSAPTGFGLGIDDCDDTRDFIYPGATELCDSYDNDCNGGADEGFDVDGDLYTSCGGDCDDNAAAVNPAATEVCDDIDNNCDGVIDEAGATGESTWYSDADSDTYGDPTDSTQRCAAPSGYVSNSDDCDDIDPNINPSITPSVSACDGVDVNCDGLLQGGEVNYGDSATCAGTSCAELLVSGASADGLYWVTPAGRPAQKVYCDMTTDSVGWTLVGVARYDQRGLPGWNGEADLNLSDAGSTSLHWHYGSDLVNALAASDEFRAECFESNNNYLRYWWGVSAYHWGSLTSATESWGDYGRTGISYPTVWATHHFGLVSGNNETVAVITAHTGNHWACAGNSGPGGEGYTGRNGVSNLRLWAR